MGLEKDASPPPEPSGFFDAATIADRDGKVLQQLQWVPGRAYEVTPR